MTLLPLLCLIGVAAAQMQPCGIPSVQPITKRIVGGKVAAQGSYPWVVMMLSAFRRISGSGSLIHPSVILTSAQHFEGPGYTQSDLLLHFWRLYTGKSNISGHDPHEHHYSIRRVVIHPGYNYTTLENDIALVFTLHPIAYNVHTRPACLADSTHRPVTGQVCYLPGWGSTRHTGDEHVLNQVDLPIIQDSVCQGHYPGYLPNTELCAGYEGGHKDWCGDDIGSPLMCKKNGAWYVQGVASSGGNCTIGDEPGVFEDVSQYSGWIKRTMTDAGYPYQY